MTKEEIFLGDWQRILIGNAPWEFMAEVFVRSIIMFFILLLVLRLLGKRMSAQLTITELAVMVTLGGIVSVPMQLPDRGILPALVVLCGTFIFQRGLNLLAFKYRKVEVVSQGDVHLLVKNGQLELDQMRASRTSRDQLFSQLRSKNIQHLGQVRRVYHEACGHFSVFEEPGPKPGLSVLPGKDGKVFKEQPQADSTYACLNCGKLAPEISDSSQTCANCGQNEWSRAMEMLPATAAS